MLSSKQVCIVKLFSKRHYGPQDVTIHWDGTDESGAVIDPGIYAIIVKCNDETGLNIHSQIICKVDK